MSAKVKKRFEEMQTYLGRDTEGLKKLKLLKDDVNELRTSLAAAKEQLEQAIAIKDAARERADAAEAELSSVRLEQDRLNQMLQGLARRATAAEAEITALRMANAADGSDVVSDAGDMAEAVSNVASAYAVLSRLREGLPFCPRPVATVFVDDIPSSIYLLTDIVAFGGWTHTDLWRLGAFVAVQSRLEGYVHIKAPDTSLMDYLERDSNKHTRFGRCVYKWVSKVAAAFDGSRKYEMVRSTRPTQYGFNIGPRDENDD